MDAPKEGVWVPRSLGALILVTFQIIGRHPLPVLVVGAGPWILLEGITAITGPLPGTWKVTRQLPIREITFSVDFPVIPFLLFPLVSGALTHIVSQIYARQTVRTDRALHRVRQRCGALIGAYALVWIGLAVVMTGGTGAAYVLAFFLLPEWGYGWEGICAFGVGGLAMFAYLMRWSLILPPVLLEGRNPWVALRRSAMLTRGQRWRIFELMSALSAFSWLVGKGIAWVGIELGVGWGLMHVLDVVALTVLYGDRWVHQEGYTATELAAALESEA